MKKLISILILMVFILGQFSCCLAAQLTVPADLTTDTLILNPQGTAPTKVQSKIYYCSGTKKLYYCYDTTKDWRLLDVDRNIATRIVSAWNSSGAMNGAVACAGDGTTCVNPKADLTCDGTDDQEGINKAINFLPANGGVVYLLEGTYNISAALLAGETIPGIVPHSNTALIGTGRATALKVASGASNVNVINASGVERILIAQLRIDGNIRTGSNNRGIRFNGVNYSKIRQCGIEYLRGGGIELSGAATKNIISDNHVARNGAEGILLSSATNNVISNNQLVENGAVDNAYSIFLSSANNNVISVNYVRPGTNGRGINLVVLSQNNFISYNNLLDSRAEGIVVDASSRNSISYNMILNSSQTGIRVQNSANNNAFIGNLIYDYDTGGTGNYYGIELLNNTDANLFSSNTIYKSQLGLAGVFGISITDANCDNNYLMGNYIFQEYDGNQEIRDASANTIYTDKWKLVLERRQENISTSPYSLDVAIYPQSYVSLNPTADITLTLVNGKAAGDILILENISATKKVSLSSGTTMKLHTTSLDLYKSDTLSLIWNGSAWVETGYSDN